MYLKNGNFLRNFLEKKIKIQGTSESEIRRFDFASPVSRTFEAPKTAGAVAGGRLPSNPVSKTGKIEKRRFERQATLCLPYMGKGGG